MKILYLLGVLSACALATPAVAQSTAPTTPATAPVPPGQRQLAEALLSTIYSEDSFNKVIDQVLVAQLKAHPEVQPYENEMRTFI